MNIMRGTFRISIVAGVATAFLMGQAQTPQELSGNWWKEICREPDRLCIGYVVGHSEALGKNNEYYCVPEGVPIGQRIAIVNAYMASHPEKLHLPFGALLVWALQDAFPCR